MPSTKHEGLLLLFQNRPMLAPELVRDALHVPLPPFTEARVESGNLTEIAPVEYRADLVVLLLEGKPVFAIIVEVQLSRDEDKRGSWPNYLTSLRGRLGCPTALLVVAPEEGVARWAAQPIETGHPDFVLKPLVMGPESIPVISDPADIARDPELAVLSAMAHREDAAGVMVAQTLPAVPGLEGERARLYIDLVLASISETARIAFEALMQKPYEYQTEFVRKWYARDVELERSAVLDVLDAREIAVDPESRARIAACVDLAQLKQWLRRAATAPSVAQLFVQ